MLPTITDYSGLRFDIKILITPMKDLFTKVNFLKIQVRLVYAICSHLILKKAFPRL